jgi:adenosylcobinamide-phosphate synthase
MGWVIDRYTQLALSLLSSPRHRWWAGIGLGIGVIGGTGFGTWLLITGVKAGSRPIGLGLEIILLASCFAGRSLRAAADDVLTALQHQDLLVARFRLRRYVGRDTETLSEAEVLRAVLETVAENATDGVMAPLFYAVVGMAIPGVGAVPLAIAYKAASTLDSMVGYREAPYADLGWFSARFEDVLTWLPCRCTVLTLGIISGQMRRVWSLCRRDAAKDPSPNAGWSECAYAAILGVRLGGMNWYRGTAMFKPYLGDDRRPITPELVQVALRLTRNSFLLWVGVATLFWLGDPKDVAKDVAPLLELNAV